MLCGETGEFGKGGILMIYNKRGQKVDVGSCSYVVGNNIQGNREYKGMTGVIVNIKVSDDNTSGCSI